MADLKEIGKQAKAARYILAGLDTNTKNKALFTAAECLEADAADILAENAKDLEAGRSRSMPEGLLDRLSLTQKRISDMAEGLRQVAALPDPVGEILDTFTVQTVLSSANAVFPSASSESSTNPVPT